MKLFLLFVIAPLFASHFEGIDGYFSEEFTEDTYANITNPFTPFVAADEDELIIRKIDPRIEDILKKWKECLKQGMIWSKKTQQCTPLPKRDPHHRTLPDDETDQIKVGPILKKYGPTVVKKLVPLIPKVGPVIAPFLDMDEMIDQEDGIVQPHYRFEIADEEEVDLDDEFKLKLGSILKKVLPIVAPHIPVVGPYLAPVLDEDTVSQMEAESETDEQTLVDAVMAELIFEGVELEDGVEAKIAQYIRPRIPQIVRIARRIPKKLSIDTFLSTDDQASFNPFEDEEVAEEIEGDLDQICFCVFSICTCIF